MATAPDDFSIKERNDLHCELFLAFIDDFKRTTRYVSLSLDNVKCYSIEFLRLLLDICSEIDDVSKLLCEQIRPGSLPDRPTIDNWRDIMLAEYAGLHKGRYVIGDRLVVTPWETWGKTPIQNPEWWKAYNDIKHNRSEHFRNATQENVFTALAGLTSLSVIAFPGACHVYLQTYVRFLDSR